MTYPRTTYLTLALILSGCSTTTVALAEQELEQEQEATVCVEISGYHSHISAESTLKHALLHEQLLDPQNACDRLKLGLLLSHPAVSFQNDAAALDQLTLAMLALTETAVDKATLGLLIEHVEERQVLRNMLGGKQRELAQKQQHIDTLRNQIDQLKNLEAQLEDKAREAVAPTVDALSPEALPPAAEADPEQEFDADAKPVLTPEPQLAPVSP